MRACAVAAVEMHNNMSQDPFYTEIYRQNAADPNRSPHFVRACAVEMHIMEIYRKNAAARIEPRMRTHTWCEPAQSKCTSTFHKSHFKRKFTGKMPRQD